MFQYFYAKLIQWEVEFNECACFKEVCLCRGIIVELYCVISQLRIACITKVTELLFNAVYVG